MRAWLRPSSIVLAILILFTLAAMAFSGRPWRGYQMPRVEQIRVLPDTPAYASVRRYTEIGSGLFPWIGGPREIGPGRQPLRLGYAYEEVGILGMPYRVTAEYGLVTYLETRNGVQFAAIVPGQVPLLDGLLGEPVARDYRFRWQRHVWGWTFPVLLILWVMLWRREDRMEEQRLLEAMREGDSGGASA